MDKVKVLVLGAGGAAGINFIKCLKMSGKKFFSGPEYYVVAADMNKYHVILPDYDEFEITSHCQREQYPEQLLTIIKRHNIDFVHAQPDVEVEELGKLRGVADAAGARTLLPNQGTIVTCRNKLKTYEKLKLNKVPVPESYPIAEISEIPERFNRLLVGNFWVWVRAITGAGSRASLPAQTPEQMLNWVYYWISMKKMDVKQFMMCEFLPGPEYAWQSVWYHGKLVCSQARERLEYYLGNLSVTGQSSSPSVARTIHNSEVNKIAFNAVKAIDKDATGIFCVDLKTNMRGIPCVTEINAGRFFTTSNFFAELGCNMPDIYVNLGMGLNIDELMLHKKTDVCPKDKYWIRQPDCEPVMADGSEFND
jgi:carbamoyl-phosphate synthase large subunit